MRFEEWFNSSEKKDRREVFRTVGVTRQYLYELGKFGKRPSLSAAARIYVAVQGQVPSELPPMEKFWESYVTRGEVQQKTAA